MRIIQKIEVMIRMGRPLKGNGYFLIPRVVSSNIIFRRCFTSILLISLINVCLNSYSSAASFCNNGVKRDDIKGQCAYYAREYFAPQGTMPGLCTQAYSGLAKDCGAWIIYDSWDLGYGKGNLPADNSLLVIDTTSALPSGHVAVVISQLLNVDGTYNLFVDESNIVPLTETCSVLYVFDPKNMIVRRNGIAPPRPVRGFVYGASQIKISALTSKISGDISITGSGFGSTQNLGHVSVTVNKMAKQEISPTTFDAVITPYSWSDTEIHANIFQNILNSDGSNFDFPVTITVYKSDGTKAGDVSYPFKDIKPSDSNQSFACAIQQLWKKNVVKGRDSSGNFVPRGPSGFVTRAEFLSMAYAANSKLPTPYVITAPFPDVTPDKWYAKYVAVAKDNGVTTGSEKSKANMICVDPLNPLGAFLNGTSGIKCFWPDDPISRYEAAIMLTALYRIPYKNNTNFSDYWTYRDVSLADWSDFQLERNAAPFIARSHKGSNGCTLDSVPVMKGDDKGHFRPDDPISREEAAGIISLAINAKPAK